MPVFVVGALHMLCLQRTVLYWDVSPLLLLPWYEYSFHSLEWGTDLDLFSYHGPLQDGNFISLLHCCGDGNRPGQ